MKKQLLTLVLLCAAPLCAADKKLFLDPHVGTHFATHFVDRESPESLLPDMRSLASSLKEGDQAAITTPASYDILFTDNTKNEKEVYNHIERVLTKIGRSTDESVIEKNLNELAGVNQATFACRKGYLVLITDQSVLNLGEEIWMKRPEGAIKTRFHSEEEFLVAIRNAGLRCTEVARPSFFGEVKYNMYHKALAEGEKGLGRAYVRHNPFTIFTVEKA